MLGKLRLLNERRRFLTRLRAGKPPQDLRQMERVISGARLFFAVVALIGLALIVWGYGQYRANGWIQLWSPPAFMGHVTVGLMLFAVIFMTAAFVPSHIKTRLKHPMLASVKTWAFAHLLSNGDLGSILLFGTSERLVRTFF